MADPLDIPPPSPALPPGLENTAPQGPLRVFLVDDEALARQRLRSLLGDLAAELPTEVVGEAANGVDALRLLEQVAADVVIVDIRMPGMDGIELAQHLAGREGGPGIIFATAYEDHALTAFELNAMDYLLKPVRATRLVQALRKAVRLSGRPAASVLQQVRTATGGGGRKHLSCHERGRLLLVPVQDILYLRAELKYVTARTREREYLLEESLTQLEQEFGDRFVRLHRAVLVARHALQGFERVSEKTVGEGGDQWWALVRDIPERLPISRRQWPNVRLLAAEGNG